MSSINISENNTDRLIKAKIPCAETGIEIRHSICDICSPGIHCGVDCYVKEDRILKLEGTPGFIPNQGTLCTKGASGRQYAYRKDRIQHPMKRVGPRGSGKFEPITWDEAFRITAENLNKSKADYGPESTMFLCGYTKWFRTFFHRLAYSFGSPNYVTESSTCFQSGVIANLCTFGSNCMPDIAASKLLIIWGYDAFTKDVHTGRNIMNFKDKGGKVILIDPRKGPMADQLADIYIRPRLGTDGMLAHAMAGHIISQGLYDREFVDKYVYGFDRYTEYVSGITPEAASEETGVPADDIRMIAELFAQTDPSTILTGNGLAHRTNGFNNIRAILALMAICGRYDRPGTLKPGTGPLTFCYSPGGFMSKEPMFINSRKPKNAPAEIGRSKYPLFVDKLNEGQGMEAARQILSGRPYPIRTAFLAGVNARMYPDTNQFRKALKSLDFIAASDLFWTECCEMADIVFPACTSYERSEVKCYINKLIYYTKPAIEPLYDSRTDYEIFSGLANALDLDDDLLRGDYDNCARFILQEGSGIEDWEAFRANEKPIPVPNARMYEWGTNRSKGVRTPTGKIELYSETIAAYNRSEMNPLPVYYANMDNADPEEYDMTMCSGARNPGMIHSRLHGCDWPRSLRPEAMVDINPADAKRLGICQGDTVRISTPISSITTLANITGSANIGELQMFHGYEEANINQIIDSTVLDPYTGYPSFKQFRCRLEKVERS